MRPTTTITTTSSLAAAIDRTALLSSVGSLGEDTTNTTSTTSGASGHLQPCCHPKSEAHTGGEPTGALVSARPALPAKPAHLKRKAEPAQEAAAAIAVTATSIAAAAVMHEQYQPMGAAGRAKPAGGHSGGGVAIGPLRQSKPDLSHASEDVVAGSQDEAAVSKQGQQPSLVQVSSR